MILQEHNDVGSFEYDIFRVDIKTLEYDMKKIVKSKPLKDYHQNMLFY